MNDQQILDNAPNGATHIDSDYDYWIMSKSQQSQFFDGEWNYCEPQEPLRCLIAIQRIAELEEALATSFEFISSSGTAEYLFYYNHKHLIKEQGE